MEARDVYMTAAQIEERKAKIAAIEGLEEIKAAIAASIAYHRAKMEFERGEREFEDVPKNNPNAISDAEKKYPRAAAFLQAERWTLGENPVKTRLGSRAMEKILDGEDPHAVLDEMHKGLAAFNLAQTGD